MRFETTQREIRHGDWTLLLDVAYTVYDSDDKDPGIVINTIQVIRVEDKCGRLHPLRSELDRLAWDRVRDLLSLLLDYERERCLW